MTRGAAGPPNLDITPPISILAPGGGEEPEAGGTGLSQRAACCSPARRLCSVTQHSLTAPSPTAAASSPSPGGTHDPRLPPALPQPLSCQSHPVVPLLAVYPHPRTTGGSSSPSTGRDRPSRGSERWRAGWGVSLQAPITSAVPVDPSGSGPAGLPAQSPRWDQRSRAPTPAMAPLQAVGERIWGVFSWRMGLKEMSGHMEKSGGF